MSAPESATLTELASGVYAWVQPDGTWWINNAGAVHGDDGVILVDTCATRRRTERFLSAVDDATGGAPIRVAINTHLHGDHVYGNELLPESTVIVGHERTREGIQADFILANTPPVWSPPPDWQLSRLRPPTVVLRDELVLYTGNRRVEVRHPGYAAHTPGDVVAWLPEERVLFTGDLVFHAVTPLVFMGSLDGALRSVDWLREFPAARVVPGHGAPIDGDGFADVLDAHARYYRFVLRTAEEARADGRTPLQAAQDCDLGEFAAWPDTERLVLNLHRAYADADGRELNLLAAISDAVTFNGGPFRCVV